MSYQKIDPIISEWAKSYNLTVYRQHQGEDIRSVDVISSIGKKYQVWVDLPVDKKVAIHAWDYKNQRRDWNVPVEQLEQALNEAVQTVKQWMV
jgi:hypothetical protein